MTARWRSLPRRGEAIKQDPRATLSWPAQLWQVLRPAGRRGSLVAVGVAIPLGMLELVGVLSLVPLVEILSGSGDAFTGRDTLVSITGSEDPTALMCAAAAIVVGTYVVKFIASVAVRWWTLGFVAREEADASVALLSRYLHAPFALHQARHSADFIRAINESVSNTYSLVLVGALNLTAEVLALSLLVTALLVILPIPTLLLAGYFAVVGVGFSRLVRPRARRYGEALSSSSIQIYKSALHALGGIKEVKVRGVESQFLADYRAARSQFADARRRSNFTSELPKYVLELAFMVGFAILAVALAWGSPEEGALGSAVVVFAAGMRALPSLGRLLGAVNLIHTGRPFLVDLIAAYQDAPPVAPASARDAFVTPLAVSLEVDRVTFSYGTGGAPSLHEVSFAVPAQSSVAIAGASGAGKSTMVDLILGLHRPDSGAILADGVDIAMLGRRWQQSIGLVPQDVFLIDDSVRANIAFGVARDAVDEERLREVCRMAQLDDVLSRFPEGLDTRVGERGSKVSGGQRQRIGVARALYHRPSLLVLDEATSALDTETEARLTNVVASLRGYVTVVVVAHRLSTIRSCDRVVLLRDGRVARTGSFDEVCQDSGFSRMVSLGMGEGR